MLTNIISIDDDGKNHWEIIDSQNAKFIINEDNQLYLYLGQNIIITLCFFDHRIYAAGFTRVYHHITIRHYYDNK